MLIAAIIGCLGVLLFIGWTDDRCPRCHRFSLVTADFGPVCRHCGRFDPD